MAALQKEIRVLECGLHDSYNAASKMSTTAAFQVGARDNRSTTSSKKKAPVCAFCKGPHSSHSCESVIDHQKRVDIVKRDNLCFNCLAHHKVSQCQSRFRCKKCKKKHHTTLCNNKPPSTESLPDNVTDSKPQTSSADVAGLLTPISPCVTPKSVTTCFLKTAVAPIIAGHTKTSANILFDEGAQRSFISREMVNELGTSLTSTADISLASFGNASRTHQKLGVVTVEIQTLSGELIPISVLVVPTIAAPIQNVVPLSVSTMPHLQGLKLAHPVTSNNNFTISLLIGTDYYWKLVQDTIIRGDGPTAQESKLSYLLSGPLPHCLSQSAASILLQITSSVTPEEPNLEKFWSVESIGTNAHTSSTDLSFLRTYQQFAITQTPEGVYIARFPWKEDKPYLPSNFNICKKRTIALVNKLKQTPELLSIYDNIIKDQQQRGFIETVTDHDATENTHYLPHRPVKKDSVTTPIRIVYDCSCRGNGNSTSLNDCLTVTPPFLNNLCSTLLRFRSHAFALSTNIEKAFLHVQLHSDDRNFTRFIWPSSTDDSAANFLTYRFAVVPFGSSSSPFKLAAVLDLHLSKVASPVALDMKDNIYVDNILSGCNTEEEILNYYKHSRELMSQANFNLRSCSSNSHQLQAVTAREKTSDPKPTVGLLGLQWNTITDTVSLAPKQLPPTNTSFIIKRDVLQTSSQIYDPLGWVTPVTVRAKILLQQVWQTKLTWDEPLPKEITDTWLTILPDLMKLSQFTVPRTYFSTSDTSTFHLYAFADASTKAYGAVVYICRNQETSLVMSKSRVAPIKTITLPKLELMAAVMATRLVQFVVSSLHFQSNDQSNHIHLWTDSQIALHWIYKQHNPKPFISHRVAEIVRALPANSWSYVPSSDNPADLLTRGIPAEQLFSSLLWLLRPSWLQCSQDWPQWTPTNTFLQLAEEEDEHGSTPPATQTSEDVTGIHTVIDITRFSTIDKLVAVTAYVLRYVRNTHTQQPRVIGPLSAVERNAAMKEWISSSQTSNYPVELNYLWKKQNSCPNLVRQLRLYLDENNS
ncbi:uncharacterized protein [Dysidea avara]|uniref:uncharacterized protein n=1 Tax=Dysidea avara TaxID=196820 RepID=UPI00333437FA